MCTLVHSNGLELLSEYLAEYLEETSYFIAVFTLHKMFKSIARYVNAAIKQNPR